ncbi:MAG: hypothetical protein P8Y26_12095 [Gemmatimonadales bacterium]
MSVASSQYVSVQRLKLIMKAKTSGPDIAPTWKTPSRLFISPVCSACDSVIRPIVE